MTPESLTSTDAAEAESIASPRRVGRVAATASLVALFNVAVALSAESLMCVPDQYAIGDWILWVWGALVGVVLVLGATAAVRGPTRLLGTAALAVGVLQAWWLANDVFNWMCLA